MGPTDPCGSSDQSFGDLLRTLRQSAGLTQAELAERASLSTRGLSDIERGINRSPRRETLLALADAFGLAEQVFYRILTNGLMAKERDELAQKIIPDLAPYMEEVRLRAPADPLVGFGYAAFILGMNHPGSPRVLDAMN